MGRIERYWQFVLDFWQTTVRRRIAYAVLTLVLTILVFFPEPYLGRAKILPQDSSSTGLNSVLNSLAGQSGVFAAFLSNRQAINLYLQISRSQEVRLDVVKSLDLVGDDRAYDSLDDALIDLDDKIEIDALQGGLIQIEAHTYDAVEAGQLTKAYTRAISDHLEKLGREQLAIKQNIVRKRFDQASQRVAETGVKLDAFRKRVGVSISPGTELGVALASRAGIEVQLQARQVALQTARRFAGPENYQVKIIQQDIASLQAELAKIERSSMPSRGGLGPSAAILTKSSAEYLDLQRDYEHAQTLFEIYFRFAEQVAVEEMTTSVGDSAQIVEAAHVESIRQYNISAFVLLLALFLLIFITEYYGPATGLLRWSDGDRNKES